MGKLAIEPIDTALRGTSNVVGRDNVTEARRLAIERVSEFAEIAHVTAQTVFATLVSRLVNQEMLELIEGSPRRASQRGTGQSRDKRNVRYIDRRL